MGTPITPEKARAEMLAALRRQLRSIRESEALIKKAPDWLVVEAVANFDDPLSAATYLTRTNENTGCMTPVAFHGDVYGLRKTFPEMFPNSQN